MSIGGIFITSIILACIRADMIHIDFGNHLMNTSEETEISLNLTTTDEVNHQVTESLKIEGILETLSEVFNDQTTTTEEFRNDDPTTVQVNIEKGKHTGSTAAVEEETDDSDTEQPIDDTSTTINDYPDSTVSATATLTLLTTTSRPKSCDISRPQPANADDPCIISCSDVSSSYLLEDIKSTLETDLINLEDCSTDEFDLSLKSIDFNDDSIERNFLSDLEVSIRYLTIKSSSITQISENAFNSHVFSGLITLEIETQSDFYLFSNQSFKGLSKLETLQMSNLSKLEPVSSLALSPLTSLISLIIYRVANTWSIEKLLQNASLTKIQTVNFQYNNFENLTFNANTFSGVCGSVETLRLANCKLKTLGVDTFSYCPLLKLLELKNNNIETLPVGIFDNLPSLQNLYLHNNKFTSVPHGLFANVLSLSSLKNISITQNNWHCDSGIVYLKQILTTHNDMILINQCETPEEFRGANIRDLWCTFDSCTIFCDNLHNDYLSNALVAYNEIDCESMQLKLNNLNLTGNTIDTNWLSNLNFNIRSLVITNTYIESIQNETFTSEFFNNLHELVIEMNTAKTFLISVNGLKGLNSLQTLKIENSAIVSLISANENFLAPVSATLSELCISAISNEFKFFDLFKSVTIVNLKTLRLYGNNFTNFNLTRSSFNGVEDFVEDVYLQNSQISKMASNAFVDFRNLKNLHLENNHLKTLSAEVFGDLVNDEEFRVYLAGNLWQCDCDIQHFSTFLHEDENVTCASPEIYAGLEIADFLTDQCQTTILIETTGLTDEISIDPAPTTTEEETTLSTTSSSTTSTQPPTSSTSTSEITSSSSTTTEEDSTTTSTTSKSSSSSTTSTETTTTTLTPDSTTTTSKNFTYSTTTTPLREQNTTVFEPQTTSTDPCRSIPPSTSTTPLFESTTEQLDGMLVECHVGNSTTGNLGRLLTGLNIIRALSSRDPITIFRPIISFNIRKSSNRDEDAIVEFTDGYDDDMVLVYYPSSEDPFLLNERNDARYSVRCISISGPVIVINRLAPDTVYNFCALYRNPYHMMITPFQCKSFFMMNGKPWLYQEQKAIIITCLTLLLLLSLVIGIIMTYFLIRKMPTLIRGSKRVVMVNNRTKEVMILPRSNSESRSNSCRKESVTPITAEPPTYLTPLPRQSFENRPPFVRSNSDTSLKSYVSVSRLPPRFSQVFQRSDFDCDSPRRCGSYSHCHHPSAPCQQHSPELPPPLPRRSVVSTASSTLHSSASTAEIGKPLSRASAHNSTYRRPPATRPNEIEQENHYNFII